MKLNKICIGLFSIAFVFITNSDFVMAYTKKELNCRELYTLTKIVEPDCKDVLDSNGNIKKKPKPKQNIDIPMVYVQGGTFNMGSNDDYDESPIHSVTVSSFYIGKYEITQKEYKAVMGTNPSDFKSDNLPVGNIIFDDAIAFCNKYNQMKGLPNAYDSSGNLIDERGNPVIDPTKVKGYRLPTEAEWEFSARGGNKSMGYKYSGSDNSDDVAWCLNDSYVKAHEVGTKKSNELGIYDMSGNVWEWVSDWYDSDYYSKSPSNNPYNKSSASERVNRGGSCNFDVNELRSFNRIFLHHNYRRGYLGFRLLRSE